MTLSELQQQRREADKNYWDNRETIDEWTRHVLERITKAADKMSDFCSQRARKVNVSDAVIRTEVIPDLLGYALQLANLFELDVEEQYQQRVNEVRAKIEKR